MPPSIGRRQLLQRLGAAFQLYPRGEAAETSLHIAGQPVEFQIGAVSAHTIRFSALPVQNGKMISVPVDGALVQPSGSRNPVRLRSITRTRTIRFGRIQVVVSPSL